MIDSDTGAQTGWLVLLFSSDLFRMNALIC